MICKLSLNYEYAFNKLNTMRLHESCIYPSFIWKHVVASKAAVILEPYFTYGRCQSRSDLRKTPKTSGDGLDLSNMSQTSNIC